jgi:hemoglobin-like flavoprotein
MDISESVEKIMGHKEMMCELFYQHFLAKHPEARQYFVNVNMTNQATFLTIALAIVEDHYQHEYRATEHYLQVLGTRHRNWGVPRELYPHFRDCLLETMAQFHKEDWDDELAAQWRTAIDKAAETMLQGYDQTYIY